MRLPSGYLCGWCVGETTPGTVVSSATANWYGVALGLVVAAVAIGISLATYDAASGGGTYVILWGAALWGGWFALKNLIERR